ncbi:hypothetical protein BGX26_001467 [Mortierella sp. AD094]|nr:hypothetical protein BGX26_001467 [Mortierella sp. AD094]
MGEQLRDVGSKPILALVMMEVEPTLSGSSKPSEFMGTWSCDRIVLIGDYSNDIPPFLTEAEEYLDPQKSKFPATSPKEFSNLEFGVMQGLFSLILYSTGSGGGDVGELRAGRWAGDHLTIREKEKVDDLDSWTDISEMMVGTFFQHLLSPANKAQYLFVAMGQYYNLINVSKRQIIARLSSDKMAEQLYNLESKPILALLMTEVELVSSRSSALFKLMGTWSCDRIVLVGDYCDDIPPFLTEAEGRELEAAGEGRPNLYNFSENTYACVELVQSLHGLETAELERLFPKGRETHHLVLNLDKKEYIDPQKFESPATFSMEFGNLQFGVMQGLFSLIFYLTEVAGGDEREFMDGPWAGDHLTIREREKVEDLNSWTDISESVVESLREFNDREGGLIFH